MHRYDKSGKQEADMHDWTRAPGRSKHRQASRSRPARTGVVEGCDLVLAEHEFAGRGIVGGVFRGRGFWNREHRRCAGQESQRDLAHRGAMGFGNRLQDLSRLAAWLRKIIVTERRI